MGLLRWLISWATCAASLHWVLINLDQQVSYCSPHLLTRTTTNFCIMLLNSFNWFQLLCKLLPLLGWSRRTSAWCSASTTTVAVVVGWAGASLSSDRAGCLVQISLWANSFMRFPFRILSVQLLLEFDIQFCRQTRTLISQEESRNIALLPPWRPRTTILNWLLWFKHILILRLHFYLLITIVEICLITPIKIFIWFLIPSS